MKRWLRLIACVLAAALLCAMLGACDLSKYIHLLAPTEKGIPEDNALDYINIGEPSYTPCAAYQPVQSRYAYQALSEGQQALYDGLLANVYQVYPEKDDRYSYRMPQAIIDGYQFDAVDIRVTVRALADDNPYLFWMSTTYSMLNDPDLNYTAVQLYSEFEPNALIGMKQELDAVIDSFYDTVSEGLSEYEREKLVHDYIIDLCEYDDADGARTELTEENIRSHSVYGALVDRVCVCEGYGTATQLLLNGLGMECVTLTGMAYDSTGNQSEEDASLHLWNAVKLDGSWYHVDPTWDDQDQTIQRYSYFNLDDQTVLRDHTLSKTPDQLDKKVIEEKGAEDLNLYIPVCGETQYNYYIYECPHLSDYSGADVTDALYTAALSGAETFSFYIEPSMDYRDAVEALFTETPQYFFGYVDQVNSDLYEYEIDNSNITYYTDEARRCVTVVLNYY